MCVVLPLSSVRLPLALLFPIRNLRAPSDFRDRSLEPQDNHPPLHAAVRRTAAPRLSRSGRIEREPLHLELTESKTVRVPRGRLINNQFGLGKPAPAAVSGPPRRIQLESRLRP